VSTVHADCKLNNAYNSGTHWKRTTNDVKLECVSDETDLREIVCEDLKSGKQCGEAVKKANRILGMIKRNVPD